MSIVTKILLVLGSAAAMEFVAWALHKYVMHGFGWALHRDHHQTHDKKWEWNDLYALFGAGLAITMFVLGSPLIYGAQAWEPGIWIGIGITLYGVIYTLVHDGLVHQRWFAVTPRKGYARRLVQAHKLHHATHSKEGGVSFGFVLARDPHMLKRELMRQKREGEAKLRRSRHAEGRTMPQRRKRRA